MYPHGTFFSAYFLLLFSGLGITCGAHRLWAHRSYQAKPLLRLILVMAQTLAIQNSVIEWARDHRYVARDHRYVAGENDAVIWRSVYEFFHLIYQFLSVGLSVSLAILFS